MRMLPIILVLISLWSLGCAEDKKSKTVAKAAPKTTPKDDEDGDEQASAATLKVGDPAPPLKVDEWLQGTPVKEFARDKVYVVEFWATWCGPCIVMMPHLGELQGEFRDQGVTVIGYSAKDPGDNPANNHERVSEFVKKRGPKLGYTFAYGDDRKTYDAWMRAAGQNGIPCCFVVDKATKIAYIGHPMFLDLVLPKVVAGTWKTDDNHGLKEVQSELDTVFKAISGTDATAGLKALAGLEAKHPKLTAIPYFVYPKLAMLLKTKNFVESKKYAEALMTKAIKKDDADTLQTVSAILRSPDAKDQKELLATALKAAETGLKIAGNKDVAGLMGVAETHFALGDKAKARAFGARALEAATPQQRPELERRVKMYDEEKGS